MAPETGTEPPLIMLDGGGSDLAPAYAALGDHRRVFRQELPGAGQTDAGSDDATDRDLARMTLGALDETEFQTFALLGASTGGTEAIRQVLARLPADAPGVVIAQHIPRAFSAQFAARMDACSALSVQEAQDGALIQRGRAFIAPGDRHLIVQRDGAHYRCRLLDAPPVNRHRPSVDVLFESMAQQVAANAVGVLLTGMGVDGARGLQQLRARGGHTIAQDEPSSVVWGMPGAAVALGAVERILPLEQIAAALTSGRDTIGGRQAAGS